jgi:hypothetical protein
VGHTRPRLERHTDQGLGLVCARRHPGRAGTYRSHPVSDGTRPAAPPAAGTATRAAGCRSSDRGRPDRRVRRLRRGGDHRGRRRQRRPEYRAGPREAHRRCLGAVLDPCRGQPRALAVLGDLDPRHRHHDLCYRHRDHHGVQPDLVVAAHAGTAAPICGRHSRSATRSHGSTATARRVTGPGRCRGSASPGVRLGGFSRPGPNLLESFRDLGVQLHRQRAEVRLQLLDRRRSDDGGGDDRVPQ